MVHNPQLFSCFFFFSLLVLDVYFYDLDFSAAAAIATVTNKSERTSILSAFILAVTLLFLWYYAFFSLVCVYTRARLKHIEAAEEYECEKIVSPVEHCVKRIHSMHTSTYTHTHKHITYFRWISEQHFTITVVNGMFLSRLQASFMSICIFLFCLSIKKKHFFLDILFFPPPKLSALFRNMHAPNELLTENS